MKKVNLSKKMKFIELWSTCLQEKITLTNANTAMIYMRGNCNYVHVIVYMHGNYNYVQVYIFANITLVKRNNLENCLQKYYNIYHVICEKISYHNKCNRKYYFQMA